MSEPDAGFDPQAYEHGQEAKELEAIKQTLTEPVTMIQGADGKDYAISALDLVSHEWRRTAVDLLKALDPEAYAEYREIKYGAGPNPSLATRREAYKFAVRRFLELSYQVAGS